MGNIGQVMPFYRNNQTSPDRLWQTQGDEFLGTAYALAVGAGAFGNFTLHVLLLFLVLRQIKSGLGPLVLMGWVGRI